MTLIKITASISSVPYPIGTSTFFIGGRGEAGGAGDGVVACFLRRVGDGDEVGVNDWTVVKEERGKGVEVSRL